MTRADIKKSIAGSCVLIAAVLCFWAFFLPIARGQTTSADLGREELEQRIQERAKILENINQQITATQESIKSTQTQRATLQQELKKIDANISQLKLNIQADELKTQKLSFEIQSTNLDIQDIEKSVQDKTDAVGHTLRKLQREGNENTLTVFLKNSSLADGVIAAQALSDLNAQLIVDINNLKGLRERLGAKVQDVSKKKDETTLHRENLVNRKLIVQDQETQKKTLVAQAKNNETTYQKQLSDLEKQQDAISDEINQIESELRARFDASVLPTKRHGALLWPIQLVGDGGKGILTQHFGERSALYKGKPHNGTDIGVAVGTPVFAADDGIVSAVDNNDRSSWSKYQYGKYILIRHSFSNFSTLYAHLSRQLVQVGAKVKRGDLIGYSGNTGYTTGAHLHFGLYWTPTLTMKAVPPAAGLVPIGVAINAEDYL